MKFDKESILWFVGIIFLLPVAAGIIIDEIVSTHFTLGQIVMVAGMALGLYIWSQLPDKCYLCWDERKGPKLKLRNSFGDYDWVHKSCLEEVNKKQEEETKNLQVKKQEEKAKAEAKKLAGMLTLEELSEITGEPASRINYWVEEGIIKYRSREFPYSVVATIKEIKKLREEKNFTTADLKDYFHS